MRLLGIHINHGFSPEARVFAGLLRHRGSAYEAKVLHHAHPGDPDSAEHFAAESCAELFRFDGGYRSWGARRTPADRVGKVLRFHLALRTLLPVARAFAPDVVYSNQQAADCVAATFLARRLARPQIVHLHYTVGPWLKRPILERLTACDHVITISDFIYRQARDHGVAPERLTTIRNALDCARFAPPSLDARDSVRRELRLPADAPLVGMVARVDYGKGQGDTIDAFARIAALHPGAHLVIVGDGGERAEREAQARASGAAGERIHFLGRREDVPRLLGAFDVFCHPSRDEPFGLAVLEAAASALPVLAYDEGGIPEIVRNERTGFLVPPGDKAALADRLSQLLQSPERARAMGAAGRSRARAEFRPEDAAGQFARVLETVVARPVRR